MKSYLCKRLLIFTVQHHTHIEPALRYNQLHLQQQQQYFRIITNLIYAIPETLKIKSQNFLDIGLAQT